ncbi:DNA/RNA polymerase [Aspergillus insuetus]
MLEYNMNDSKITALLWGLTKANYAIPNMATVSCSPMYDCIRNVTGAMAADIVASECLSIGKCFGWANCPPTGKYQGGYVVAPVRGIHDSVAVCDFSSMYPTIMMGVNISPDSVLPQTESIRSEGAVTWDGKSAAVVCSGKVIRFSNVTQSVIPKVLRKLVDERKRHRAKFPNYANALKVAANSIYGSLGYEFSPLYSPSCSAATTAYGRWCLSLSICIFEKCGLSVLYGDTDSCFLTRTAVTGSKYGGDLRLHCNAALRVLKNILMFTPFRDMDMCLEDVHERVLLLEKKNYAYMSRSGDARYKGISAARKDALGICRKVSKCTVDMILNGGVSTDTKSAIALMYATALDSCALGSLALADVSKVIRSEGGNCYSYIDFNGNKKDVRVEDASPDSIVRYSKSEVATRITREITRYTSAAGLGGATDIMWWCPVFESLGISNR